FNFPNDIQGVAGMVRTPNVMDVNPNVPAKTVAEFIAYCKANPGKINMASSGSGTSVHLSGELFKTMTGCDMLHVPYKGAGPALTDLMANQVQVIFDNLPSSSGFIRSGRLRALGMTSSKRDPGFPDVPTVAEFIAYCKANPGKINMASSGSGTSVHLSGEMFKVMTGCDMLHVPYKGAGPALTDLMANHVQVMFDNLPSSSGFIRAGKLRALGMTSDHRDPGFPDVPTVGDTVKGYEATAWFGLGMPKGSPREAIDKVNAEVNRALADPEFQKRLAELGGTPIPGTPDDFTRTIAHETEKWAKVVTASGAKVE
ncbi:MAG TPA: tripartite tricarboxylate transporter substrate-binding protein, partial [Usitatibacter sp.]|nr:tripartite tricarboxylate transporter substrate-binding protein [Usitatibacter sp.]